MTLTPAFWDASALVPLCVQEASSNRVRLLIRKYHPVAWWASTVEVHSAICRLHRQQLIDDSAKQRALARLEIYLRGFKIILPDESLLTLARTLLNLYPLRAADSLQLAAALTWCQHHPAGRIFVSFDARLNEAARVAGFTSLETWV